MQEIRFPGLHLNFSISRVAFEIGTWKIYWYAIFIVVALALFLSTLKKRSEKYGLKQEDLLDLMIWLIPISFLCARLYYVLFAFDQYENNLLQIFNLRTGGLAIYGGMLGGIFTCYFFCKKRGISFLEVTDLIVPYLALGQAIGRWGNFLNQEAYGTHTSLPWRMEIMQKGEWIGVHPTFLYESLADFFIFGILIYFERKRIFSGQLTYLYLILYSFIRIGIEQLRTDSLLFFGVRISQIVSIFLFVICYTLLAKQLKKYTVSEKDDKIPLKKSHEI